MMLSALTVLKSKNGEYEIDMAIWLNNIFMSSGMKTVVGMQEKWSDVKNDLRSHFSVDILACHPNVYAGTKWIKMTDSWTDCTIC